MILRAYRVDLSRSPAEGPERPLVLADEASPDLDAVAAHVDDRAAARLLRIPEPGAVRSGVGLARPRPEDAAERALLHRREGFEGLRRVDEVLEIAGENPCLLHGFEHLAGFGSGSAEGFGAQDGFPGLRGEPDGFFVYIVGEPDDHDLGFGILDGVPQV